MGKCCTKFRFIKLNKNRIKLKEINYINLDNITDQKIISKNKKHNIYTGMYNQKLILVKKKKYKDYNKEAEILNEINNKFIIKCICNFIEEDYLFLIFNYENSYDLFDYFIEKENYINENMTKNIINQVVSGLNYLHNNKKIIHRDIKPENIIINEKFDIKIIDFDLAIKNKDVTKSTKVVGTKYYVSPNYLSSLISTYSDDIWALGITTYVLLFKDFPFPQWYYTNIVAQRHSNFFINKNISSKLKKFLEDTTKMKNRITSKKLKNHVWFK